MSHDSETNVPIHYFYEIPRLSLANNPGDCSLNFYLRFLYLDFNSEMTNPLYKIQCPNVSVFKAVLAVCYAYCFLKFCIVLTVYFY